MGDCNLWWADVGRQGIPHLWFGVTPEQVAPRLAAQVYVATPYTRRVTWPWGVFEPGQNYRLMREAASQCRRLARVGVSAFSPIVISAAMVDGDQFAVLDPLDAAFWTRWCAPFLAASAAVVVPDLPGWRDSAGVRREVSWALDRNMPVYCYGQAPL